MKKILLTIHLAIAAGLLVTGYAPHLNPQDYGILALAGYVFPAMLVLTLLSLALCALTARRHLPVPVAALLLAYGPVTLYTPLHLTEEVPEGALKVISYNTHDWGQGASDDSHVPDGRNGLSVITYLAESNADIIALQESTPGGPARHNLDTILNPQYEYHDTVVCPSRSSTGVYSRYPIKRKQSITQDSDRGGCSAAFWLDVNGREVLVINNHLQSTGLSIEQRNRFSAMVHGGGDTIRTISRGIVSKLLESSRIRVPQAENVAAFVRRHRRAHPRTPIIICGDFNDIPLSYTHRVISDGLTDCYAATALGPGFSYKRYAMRVRIDNVLCTPDLTPYNFHTDHSINTSDHYPIVGWLAMP